MSRASGGVGGWVRGVAQWALGPLVATIRSGGGTPQSAAWAMGVGIAIGTVPFPGAALPAAVAAAGALGLSQAVTSASMLLAAPLQLLMFTPFVQIGLALPYFQGDVSPEERLQELKDIMASGALLSNLGKLQGALAAGVAAWLVLLPALCCLGYVLALPIAKRIVQVPPSSTEEEAAGVAPAGGGRGRGPGEDEGGREAKKRR